MKEPLKQISDLVERFERNIEAYRSPAYNETQLRIEFIDPFFEALGWDVTNKAGYAEQYKDVIHEDAIKIAGATKAPDYCFRIGGVRKVILFSFSGLKSFHPHNFVGYFTPCLMSSHHHFTFFIIFL